MDNKFIRVDEVAQELSVSKPYAYKLIKRLNDELKECEFATKSEAQEWEQKFQLQNFADLDMDFEAFTELYANDVKNRLKKNTWLTKEHIIRTKILPYFGKMKISEISTKEIIAWQNKQLAHRDEKRDPCSQTYLKTVHNQLSAIFNHAVRPLKPCGKGRKLAFMGSKNE